MRHRFLLLFLFLSIGFSLLSAQEMPNLEALFERLDRDKNGELSGEEFPRRAEFLARADTDQSGGATIAEIKAAMQKASGTPDPAAKPIIHVAESFPENSPVSEASCRAAAEYSVSKNGYSFLVLDGTSGKILFERYDQGWNPEKPHRLASGTKSFSGIIAAAAVQDKLLTLDEPVSQTIPEWKNDKRKASITIRQLLSLTSGINPGKVGRVPSYKEAIQSAMESAPGKKFSYGPAPFQIFGEVMRRKLTAREDFPYPDPLAYLKDRVLDPIEMEYADWRRDDDRMPHLPSGAHLTAREWAKLGKFLLQDGEWNGEQLVDATALQECRKGSAARSEYGITFWLAAKNIGPGLKDLYMAAGAGKQRLYLLPKQNLVVVRQGESKGAYQDATLLQKLLKKK